MLEGFAEYYSAELAEKTKRGMKENALKGKWNGGQIPFGYTVKDNYLAIDETLAPIVRKLFEMCADGVTVKDIHKYVQEKGILRPNGKKITYSSLRYLLSNRVYIGEYRHSGIVHENVVPAIVDREVYERAQEQIRRTAHAPARHKAEDDYLLTLKLYCGHCGALMTAYAGTSMPDLAKYDVVMIGTPVWNGSLTNPVMSYLEQTDFKGKIVAPFWTYAGTVGTTSSDFRELIHNADIREGLGLNHVSSYSEERLTDTLTEWYSTFIIIEASQTEDADYFPVCNLSS